MGFMVEISEEAKKRVEISENQQSHKSLAKTPWLPPSGPPDHKDTPIDVLPAAVDDDRTQSSI